MGRSRYKKIGLLFASGILLLIIVGAATPVWFPWVVGPVGKRFGLTYQNYDRLGYSRFAATSVVFSNRNVVVKGERVETFVPTALLWELWFGHGSPPSRVEGWSVTVHPAKGPKRQRGPPSTRVIVRRVDKVFTHLRRWLPTTFVTNGMVTTPDVVLEIPNAAWRDGVLSGSVVHAKTRLTAAVRGVVQSNAVRSLTIVSDKIAADLDGLTARFERTDIGDAFKVVGVIEWLANTINVNAEFDRVGLLPDRAALTADPLVVPAQLLKSKPYEALRGRVAASWQDGSFQIESSAIAQPKTTVGVPPFTLELRAHGDTNAATVELATLASSAITAELSEPLLVQYKAPFITESIILKAFADLSQQQWLAATGRVDVRALVFPFAGKYPAVNLQLSGSGLQLRPSHPVIQGSKESTSQRLTKIPPAKVDLEAELRWPSLIFSTATVQIPNEVRAEAMGEVDLQAGSVVAGSMTVKSATADPWTPKDLSISNITLSADFRGLYRNLIHKGRLMVDSVETHALRPARIVADWEGQHLNFTNVNVVAGAGQSTVSMRLAADLAQAQRVIHIAGLTMLTNEHETLTLTAPAAVTLSPITQHATRNTQHAISLSPLSLTGDATVSLEGFLHWPVFGQLTTTATNLEASLFQNLVKKPLPPVHVDHWQLGATWSNGPVAFTLQTEARVTLTNGAPVIANVRASGTAAGLALQSLSISSQLGGTVLAPALTGEGFLPLTFDPQTGVKLHDDRTLNFRFSTVPDAAIWNELASRARVRVEAPTVNVLIGGSWKEPHGTINAAIERIALLTPSRPLRTNSVARATWPGLSNARLTADVNRDRVTINQAHIEVEGQPIDATAEMPLGDQFWNAVVERKVAFDWKQVTAHLVVPQTDVQPFARFLPELIAPQGRLHADLTLTDGELTGVARVQDLRTRPLAGLGPVRDLDIRAQFTGDQIAFQPIDARIGGRQVHCEGTVRVPPNLRLTNALPEFHFRLWGANVPLTRQADVVIRGDLELELTNSVVRPPEVTGGITLRNSYFLSDLKDLVPGKVAGPKRRPPYFSITNERFANWRLAVNVRGDEFIKIRSPLFRGVASSTVRLEGTLSEPAALGEVRIGSGRILFPFATLQVDQGFVTLTSEDPYRPHLNVVASSRRIGYEIKVEVTGPADEPIVQFSSTPPLSPEQIVLMLTAGQMPSETARITTEQRAQRMALFVGGNLLHEFGIGGGDEERLSVRSGEQLTETGTQTYEAEYKLTDDWSVVGEYDRFNEFNVGLKWRVYSK
jgi:translocation and assembly module TamB